MLYRHSSTRRGGVVRQMRCTQLNRLALSDSATMNRTSSFQAACDVNASVVRDAHVIDVVSNHKPFFDFHAFISCDFFGRLLCLFCFACKFWR